jgi:type II secretory pathway pseudopilin PulG
MFVATRTLTLEGALMATNVRSPFASISAQFRTQVEQYRQQMNQAIEQFRSQFGQGVGSTSNSSATDDAGECVPGANGSCGASCFGTDGFDSGPGHSQFPSFGGGFSMPSFPEVGSGTGTTVVQQNGSTTINGVQVPPNSTTEVPGGRVTVSSSQNGNSSSHSSSSRVSSSR